MPVVDPWKDKDDETLMYDFQVNKIRVSKLKQTVNDYGNKIPFFSRQVDKVTKYPDALKYKIYDDFRQTHNKEPTETQILKEFDKRAFYLMHKLARLTAKKRAVMHKINNVGDTGKEHKTVYYIDLDAGNDGNTGLSTVQAWLTLQQYTTNTVRTAGDIAYVRANTSQVLAANVVFDEDGTVTDFIKIIGCDSAVNDPWGDGSDVKPIVDCGGAANQLLLIDDNCWWIERFNISNGTSNVIYYIRSNAGVCKDCDIHDNTTQGCEAYMSNILFTGCSFYSNINTSLKIVLSHTNILNSKFDGGVATTDIGLMNNGGAIVELDNCDFGVTTQHDIYDIYLRYSVGRLYGRNIIFNSPTDLVITGGGLRDTGISAHVENYGNTHGDNRSWYYNGTVKSDASILHAGGADSSAKIEPNTKCTLNHALTLSSGFFDRTVIPGFAVWCPASPTTVTVYIRSLGAWATYPTSSELYLSAMYWNGSDFVESTKSIQVLSDGTTWVAFTTTFTPSDEGWAYVNVFLKKYEASKGCYVDIKPVVS